MVTQNHGDDDDNDHGDDREPGRRKEYGSLASLCTATRRTCRGRREPAGGEIEYKS